MFYINTQTQQYPLSEYEIKQANPNTSFSSVFSAPDGYAPVEPVDPPTCDNISQYVREVSPVLVAGKWTQQWEVVELDLAAVAANQAAARKARVPTTLTVRQAKLALLAAGLLDDVDAAVAGADRATQVEWEYATTVERTWPTLVAMATALGMTDTQLDNLFIQGAAL